ncbi:MAG: rod shape-determining protein RodA [Actinomycetia bacterium]|nr:rod shape-determining protein RodA [Actinomycetes bacterium]MCP4958490.1 rod shape-determining protein RodA [Actinomycetes bacterium]
MITSLPVRRDLRSPVRYVDWLLPLTAIAISIFGIFMNYSATWRLQQFNGDDPYTFARRQAVFVVFGIAAMIATSLIDYRVLREFAPQIYLITLAVLVAVLFVGKEVNGAKAWFQLPGGIQIQPSEFGKVAAITALAAFAASHSSDFRLDKLLNSLLIVGVPMSLVFLQNDLGTMLVYVAIMMGILFVAGTRIRHIVVMTLLGIIAATVLFQFDDVTGIELIGAAQEQRLTAFLDQESDLDVANYNLQQSQIAIGSGGLTGRGYLNGIQTNLDLVPAQETDFIFTAAGEELGFLFGALPLLGAYLLLVWRILRAAQLSRDMFGTLVCTGVLSMLLFQIFQNLGMTMGIMPITGIPLPFMSHGGSSVIAAFVTIGLVINVRSRRYAE